MNRKELRLGVPQKTPWITKVPGGVTHSGCTGAKLRIRSNSPEVHKSAFCVACSPLERSPRFVIKTKKNAAEEFDRILTMPAPRNRFQ